MPLGTGGTCVDRDWTHPQFTRGESEAGSADSQEQRTAVWVVRTFPLDRAGVASNMLKGALWATRGVKPGIPLRGNDFRSHRPLGLWGQLHRRLLKMAPQIPGPHKGQGRNQPP